MKFALLSASVPFVVDAAFDLLTVEAGGTLVVPCRTTLPDLPVKLEINWGVSTRMLSSVRFALKY